MTQIIDGKAIANQLAKQLADEVIELKTKGVVPKLAIVTYKPDERSRVYIRLKQQRALEVGIEVESQDWSDNDQDDCMRLMHELGQRDDVHSIIVQLPISGWYDPQMLLDLIPIHKDVDGLSQASMQALQQNNAILVPATPLAIMTVLQESDVDLNNKKIVLIGNGKMVGMPLSILLRNLKLDVTVCDITTTDISAQTSQADVLISAAGQPKLITADMVKDGAVVLDVGIVEIGGKLTGDVDYESVERKVSMIAKVPGGVGPVTVVCLLQNVVSVAKSSSTS
jgi:methylenetetrahydrofolate dehydrogenase (NADP+)/methenyltetrahydrofolate cyclohydrolase